MSAPMPRVMGVLVCSTRTATRPQTRSCGGCAAPAQPASPRGPDETPEARPICQPLDNRAGVWPPQGHRLQGTVDTKETGEEARP